MSRKITEQVASAFLNRRPKSIGNSSTDGHVLLLHGNRIAEWHGDDLWITNAGWSSNTTKERLNGLPGVRIHQKDFAWFLNGKQWDGSWTSVSLWNAGKSSLSLA
jgi:hypothetical protein